MTKRVLLFCALLGAIAFSKPSQAQFNISNIQYWIGSGSDSAILVVDFRDGSWDSSYAWGYLFNGSATAQMMLNAIAAADVNFSVVINSGFLSNIVYGNHAGIGGTGSPQRFWSTWTGTSGSNLAMNGGISESLSNREWFGCSFTDFNPAVVPSGPIPAFDPFRFTLQNVAFWVGTGTDSSILVVDFLSSSGPSSFAWGYRYSGVATGAQMLNEVAAADPGLAVAGSGFLNNITYNSFAGIGGTGGNFWAIWSATNLGNWDFNIGIGDTLTNGSLFGCSFTNFAPAIRPGYPVPAPFVQGLALENVPKVIQVYPNPATDFIRIQFDEYSPEATQVMLMDATGKQVFSGNITSEETNLPVYELASGLYTVVVKSAGGVYQTKFVKP